jgi:hypothetical protein
MLHLGNMYAYVCTCLLIVLKIIDILFKVIVKYYRWVYRFVCRLLGITHVDFGINQVKATKYLEIRTPVTCYLVMSSRCLGSLQFAEHNS